ncbi:MAG: glucose-1-phosphate thymidylyltransferase [Bacteroidetes bacterium 4572_77]|nr:MAG: glucose-1-phosphate thymidylyltransferase [Bacteroidetes bacterium 4572_77]
MKTKGIILAGGKGTRLYPLTKVISKQLLPIYDKPMIYYPLATLISAGIKAILIIVNPEDLTLFEKLLGDGKQWNINISYKVQEKPRGIAEAFIIGENFIDGEQSCLILGDNLFYGDTEYLKYALENNDGASIFAYKIDEPQRYGVVEFDGNNNVISIEEKPENPKSDYAIPGLYIFDKQVSKIAKKLKPSTRNELEITDLQKEYLKIKKLKARTMNGVSWFDTGTHDSLLDAAEFIRAIQKRQGLDIACLDELSKKI